MPIMDSIFGVPQQPSGTVALFPDDSWIGDSLSYSTSTLRKNYREDLPSKMQDRASRIAFNLPVGTVVTLTDDIPKVREGPIWEMMKHTGRLVDLIGTGKTEAVYLDSCNMNDCASTIMWRTVDVGAGMVHLFEDTDFKGNRTAIFLSEWPDALHKMDLWYINDRASSVRYWIRDSHKYCVLMNDTALPKDSNSEYVNLSYEFEEIKDLRKLTDRVSAFIWGPRPSSPFVSRFPGDPR
jgi:hypothetical protein